jgi:hypothetical protein
MPALAQAPRGFFLLAAENARRIHVKVVLIEAGVFALSLIALGGALTTQPTRQGSWLKRSKARAHPRLAFDGRGGRLRESFVASVNPVEGVGGSVQPSEVAVQAVARLMSVLIRLSHMTIIRPASLLANLYNTRPHLTELPSLLRYPFSYGSTISYSLRLADIFHIVFVLASPSSILNHPHKPQ